MMMYTRLIYNKLVEQPESGEEKFKKNLPVYEKMDKVANSWATRIAFGTAYVIFYIIFAQYWWLYLLLPIHFLMGPIHGAIVNWAGHKYGYRNFEEGDQSKNTLIIDFLMLGELFQNNHHHAGARANFAAKWWEFDPVYPVIKLFHWLRIIRLTKVPA